MHLFFICELTTAYGLSTLKPGDLRMIKMARTPDRRMLPGERDCVDSSLEEECEAGGCGLLDGVEMRSQARLQWKVPVVKPGRLLGQYCQVSWDCASWRVVPEGPVIPAVIQ